MFEHKEFNLPAIVILCLAGWLTVGFLFAYVALGPFKKLYPAGLPLGTSNFMLACTALWPLAGCLLVFKWAQTKTKGKAEA